jgi:hypothetical protein
MDSNIERPQVVNVFWYHPDHEKPFDSVYSNFEKWESFGFHVKVWGMDAFDKFQEVPYDLLGRVQRYYFDPKAKVRGVGYPKTIGRKAISDLFRWSLMRSEGGIYSDLDNEPLIDPCDYIRNSGLFDPQTHTIAMPEGHMWDVSPCFLWMPDTIYYERRAEICDRMFKHADYMMKQAEKRGNHPNLMRGSATIGPGVQQWVRRKIPHRFCVIPKPFLWFDLPPKYKPPFPKDTVILNHGRWKAPWGED